MKLETLAHHTIDLELLPERPIVLDVGCRFFDFTDAILAEYKRPDAVITAMDPATDIIFNPRKANRYGWGAGPLFAEVNYLKTALVGFGHARQEFVHYGDGQSDHITMAPGTFFDRGQLYENQKDAQFYDVDCVTISELMLERSIRHFDVVKLDCEGSEFSILENWPGPIATQISVEFHDVGKRAFITDRYYDQLFKRLRWYKVVQHPWSDNLGHSDTLLVLK